MDTTLTNHKVKFVLVIIILLVSPLTYGQKAYAATVTVHMDRSHDTIQSDRVWGSAGNTIYFQWVNDYSIHNVGVGVYYEEEPFSGSGVLVSDIKVASSGNGSTYDFFTAPRNGYYYLRASCGGNGQTGCRGDGLLNSNW